MGKLILIVILSITTNSYGMGPDVAQQQAGAWVNKWWEEEIVINQALSTEDRSTCDRRIEYYQDKLADKPDSEYYKWRLKKWIKRCASVENIPFDIRQ